LRELQAGLMKSGKETSIVSFYKKNIFAALSPRAFLDTFTFRGSRKWFPDSQHTLFIGFSVFY
jgi:hypothetical protein